MGSSPILLEAGGCKWGCEGGPQKEAPLGVPISIQVGARVLLGSPFPVLEEPPHPKWERNASRTLWAAWPGGHETQWDSYRHAG